MPGTRQRSQGRAPTERLSSLPASLSEAGQRLLAALALHEGPLPAAWLRTLKISPNAIDELNQTQALEEVNPSGWRLRVSPQAARSLAHTFPWALRADLHRKLAELGRTKSEFRPQAARHLAHLGDWPEAIEVWLQTAADAIRRASADDAHAALESALSADSAAWSATHWQQFARVLESSLPRKSIAAALAASLAAYRDTPAVAAHLLPWLAAHALTAGRHVEAANLRREAGRALLAIGDTAGAARQFTAAAMALAFALHLTPAREAAEAAVRAAQDQPALLVEAHTALGLALGARGDTAEGVAHLERALDLALRHRFTGLAANSYHLLGTVQEYASCYGDQLTAFSRALTYCRRHDETDAEALCLGCLSYALFRAGNWTRARTIAEQVLARPRTPPVSLCVASAVLGLLQAHRGEIREATRTLETARRHTDQSGVLAAHMFIWWGFALVEEQHSPEGASWHYRSLLDYWRTTEDRHDALPGFTAAAIYYGKRREFEAVREVATALQTIAAEVANPEAQGAAAIAAGELTWLESGPHAAVAHFRVAAEQFERRSLIPERMRALLRLAAALLATDAEPQEPKRLLKEVREAGRRLGARFWVTEAEQLLQNIPSAPRTEVRQASAAANDLWAGLSPRQRDVARQLCRGASNKDIARHLGLSVRTIDMHVAHLLDRLDCRSRGEAAARLGAVAV